MALHTPVIINIEPNEGSLCFAFFFFVFCFCFIACFVWVTHKQTNHLTAEIGCKNVRVSYKVGNVQQVGEIYERLYAKIESKMFVVHTKIAITNLFKRSFKGRLK